MVDPLQHDGAKAGPSLFRQIAVRLVVLTVAFAVLNIGIVVVTYSSQPESLAQELLSLEASKIGSAQELAADAHEGPPGANHWLVRYVEQPPAHAGDQALSNTPGALVDWTQRERVGDGYRVTGVRTVMQDGKQRWLFMHFEGEGLRPYLPVILNEILQHAVLPLVPLVALMLAFNIFAVRRVLDPLRNAEKQVDELDPENMALRLSEPPAPREVNTLVRAVNRALSRLDSAVAILRTFTANAAHELRTPLSIMQLTIDRLPPGKVRDELSRDNLYMTRLVSQMLDLAQADALMIDDTHIIDLADIGREVVGALSLKAFDQDREIRFFDNGETQALGHSEAIYRVLRNLIDNALAHAGGDRSIDVVAGPGPLLTVRDFGSGIAVEDHERVFERFWRADRRRSDGAGLGLGIVKRIVEAHHGTISIESPAGGGALFTVKLQSPV